MGYKLIIQLTLLAASLVIIFAFAQPELSVIKEKEDKLLQYNEAISKASQYNARLRELLSIRDSFSKNDLDALEKFVPVSIDQLKTMSEIAGIFSSRNITVTSMAAGTQVTPAGDVSFEDSALVRQTQNPNLSYQDFEVSFVGTYEQMRDILLLTEASESLLEIVELNFTTASAAIDPNKGVSATQGTEDEHIYTIIFRTYGLPIATSV